MEDLINKLPDNCLQHIFSFLDIWKRLKVERVCKRWHNIGKEGWPDMTKLNIFDHSDNRIPSILKRCGRFLRDITIWLSSSKNCLSMIITFCRLEKLKRIMIQYEPYRKDKLEMCNWRIFFEKSQNLKSLKICGNLEEYWIDYINLANPKTLQELVIMNENDVIACNPDRFPNSKELELAKIFIHEDDVISEEESLKELEIISISDCYVPRSVVQRFQNFTNLQDVFLHNNLCDIRNEDIREIVSHCDKITELHLGVTVKTFNYRYSLSLEIPGLTSECFQYLGKMQSLRILSLSGLKILNSHDIVYLPNVTRLTFDACPYLLPDDGLIQLITNSSNLEELNLFRIRDFDINLVNDVQLIFHHGLRQKYLDFTACIDYRDEFRDRPSIVIDEPLLKLRVHVMKKSSEDDSEEDDLLNF